MSKAERQRTARAQRAMQAARQPRRLSTTTLLATTAVVALAVAVGVGVTLAGRHTTAPGLQTGPAPWPPEYAHLPARLTNLHLPDNGNESYHIHAHLAVYVDGQPVTVPANVGISMADRLESPMHTHDTTGVIHIEASQPSTAFALGAFLDIWGVTFTSDQLGGYHNSGDTTVLTYVNGQPVTDPARYVLYPHDNIVIGYGTTGSFPHTVPFPWPAGE